MTQGLDEWFDSYKDRSEWDKAPPIARDSFEAGAASRQDEVDELKEIVGDQLIRIGQLEQTQKELQKRIDGFKKMAIQKKIEGLFYWS